jgi:hypothetical protein
MRRWLPDWRLIFPAEQFAQSPADKIEYNLWEVAVDRRTASLTGKPKQLTQWSDYYPQCLAVTADGRRLSFVT